MLMDNSRLIWNRIFLPRIAAKLAAETVSVNPAVGYSCGAAMEGSPRLQPWVGVLAMGAAKRRKDPLWPLILSPLTRLLVMAHFPHGSRRGLPLFRHTVADGLRNHCPI